MKVRTRYAPSPTGRMHVGNLRTALYAYLIAKHEGGDFLLRIEDTDQERYVEGAVDIIYRTLEETGLVHDEGPDKDGGCGPYVQSERQASGIYMEYAKKLVEKGEAYYCFCTPERLETLRKTVNGEEIMTYDKHCLHLSKEEVEANLAAGKPFVIRQNNPTEGTTTFHDEIYGDITVDNSELDDMVLIKSDGYPTYNFANVVDDHLMGITHVVRGNEYLSSSPKYNRLYDAFGWEVPVYVHCPLITDESHHKLSKRCGHSSFEDLVEQGFVPEAIVNYVALLGWSPEGNNEIFSLEEMVKEFDYHRMNKSPSVFDMTKLRWMNGEYIKAMDFERFYKLAEPYLKEVITMISEQFDYVVIDGEAGIEQINRRVMEKVTHLLLISDTSKKGLEVIKTIENVAMELVKYDRIGLIVNRVEDPAMIERLDTRGLELLAAIPSDKKLALYDFEGRSIMELPEESPVVVNVRDAMQKFGILL